MFSLSLTLFIFLLTSKVNSCDFDNVESAFEKAKEALTKLSDEGNEIDGHIKRQLQITGEGIMKAAADAAKLEQDPAPEWATNFLRPSVNSQTQSSFSLYDDVENFVSAEGQQNRRPGRKELERVKRKRKAINTLIKSIDTSTSKLIKMQRLSNEESNKAGAQDQSAVAFVSPQNLINLRNQCDEAQATLNTLLGKLHAARVLAGDPSVRNPIIQVLYYNGNKAVHFLKGGPEEEGFPMSQSLFQAHTIGVIDSLGGVDHGSTRNLMFPEAPVAPHED